MSALRFGINALNQLTTWDDYLKLCLESEAMGFDSLWACDHLLVGPSNREGPVLDAFTSLAALAVSTRRITLGTLVVATTFRHPAFVARMGAMVDILSGGRFVLGLGAGAYELEHRVFGIPFPSPGERLARLEETVRIVRSLWTSQSTTFEGRYFQLDDAALEPFPVQQPHPPILLAAQGPRMLEITARYADIHNAGTRSPDLVRDMNATLDACCAAQGRNPKSLVRSAVILNGLAPDNNQEVIDQQFERLFNRPIASMTDRMVRGSDEEAIEQIQAYLNAGVSHLMFTAVAPFNFGSLRRLADVTSRLR